MSQQGNLTVPQSYSKCTAITLSDVTVYNPPIQAFIVGASGNLAIVDNTGAAVTLAVVAGTIYPIQCQQMKATGSTATGVVALSY